MLLTTPSSINAQLSSSRKQRTSPSPSVALPSFDISQPSRPHESLPPPREIHTHNPCPIQERLRAQCAAAAALAPHAARISEWWSVREGARELRITYLRAQQEREGALTDRVPAEKVRIRHDL